MRPLFRSFAVIGPLVLLALVAWVVARGAVAETPCEPVLGEPPLAQVRHDDELGLHVCGVIQLPHSLEEVWQVLTNQDRYGDLCPYLHQPTFEPDPARTTRLTGRVQGWANTFPLRVLIRQEQLLDEYRATWEGADEPVLLNRGRWVVRRVSERQSLVEVAVAAEVRHVPTFLVRNLFRDRLCQVLHRLKARMADAESEW